MKLVIGSCCAKFGSELAKLLKVSPLEIEIRRFPDGECYIRFHESLDDDDVILVQNTYPDGNLVELLLLSSYIAKHKTGRFILVIPYYGYARQDKLFKEGEVVSAVELGKFFQKGTDGLITIDLHSPKILDDLEVPSIDVSAMAQIGLKLKELGVEMVLSPDKGAKERARKVAEVVGCPWNWLNKTRLDGKTVFMEKKDLLVLGKKVAIVDDIISTGGTIRQASRHLREQGAKEIYAACTHGLFTGEADKLLSAELDLLFCSDTLESGSTLISAAPAVAEKLRDLKWLAGSDL